MQWQRDITAAAETFAGYRGTDVYPPAGGQREEWVIVIHFDGESALQQWLQSPLRARWVEQLRARTGDFELKMLPAGFGPWFAGLMQSARTTPPAWKMVLTVLLGLYPTVMLLTRFVGPYLDPLGLSVSMLIGNALSVCLLQWVVMPTLTLLLRRWLNANAPGQKFVSLAGLGAILLLLAILTAAFRLGME